MVLGTNHVNQAGGIVEHVEFFVSQNVFVLLGGRVRILGNIGKEIFLTLIGKPFHGLLPVNNNKLPGLAIARTRGKTGFPDDVRDCTQWNLFLLKIPNGSSIL